MENALLDYDDTANRTLSGTSYRCRDCGQLYETIEEHDRHRRKVHNQIEKYPLEELPM
ncbi:MAG: hypothetical protein LBH79_02495 [Nitrososphaerota archaeon]|nr:hypothetical protein [Nitrososphaerota archaeon]